MNIDPPDDPRLADAIAYVTYRFRLGELDGHARRSIEKRFGLSDADSVLAIELGGVAYEAHFGYRRLM